MPHPMRTTRLYSELSSLNQGAFVEGARRKKVNFWLLLVKVVSWLPCALFMTACPWGGFLPLGAPGIVLGWPPDYIAPPLAVVLVLSFCRIVMFVKCIRYPDAGALCLAQHA